MKIILKKTFRGLVSGVIVCAAFYLVCLVIEIFSFIKAFLASNNLTDDVISGNGGNSGSGLSLSTYTPFLSFWNWSTILMILGIASIVGAVIGFIVGCISMAENKKRVQDYNNSVIEDGSDRQRILFATNIKTMAESLTDSCTETLHYMTNFVKTDYASAAENEAVMTELVKFIEYEQILKDSINNREGGC